MPWHYYMRCVDKIKERACELGAERAKKRGQEEAARRVSRSSSFIRTGLQTMPELAGSELTKAHSQSPGDAHATKAQNVEKVVVPEGPDDPFVSPTAWVEGHSVVPPKSSDSSHSTPAQSHGQKNFSSKPTREAQSWPEIQHAASASTDQAISSPQPHFGSHAGSRLPFTSDAQFTAGGLILTRESILV